MGKLLSWIAIIALVYAGMRLFVILQRKSRAADARRAAARPAPQQARPGTPERMLPCDHCGVHAPASDMIRAEGRHFCSPEHRDAFRG
jgi:uncharacterized protein